MSDERSPATPNSADRQAAVEASPARRRFLRNTAAMAGGGALAATGAARAAPVEVAGVSREPGRPIAESHYGQPSKYEAHVARRRTDILKNRQNWSDWSMTPLQHQPGIITPNGLVFERHHSGVPDIDPATHRFAIHGMVKQPLIFTMEDLVRYPSVSRFHFHECSGNGLTDWLKPASTTVQQTHGLLSGVLWTGVPASILMEEAGLDPAAAWVLFEGADSAGHARSIPMEKVMDDAIIAYAMNGERLRPENGYPLRLVLPGWEGNTSIKWLRRAKVGDKPWHLRSETARYTDPMPDGKWRQFSMVMETKSVITSPSGGQQLKKPGFYEVTGLAWSGSGKIRAVDVSFDGGKSWREAVVEGPVMDKALTRFKIGWDWDGRPAVLMSRAVDSNGYVQPSVADLQKTRAIVGFVQHHNAIQPWTVNEKGEVRNAIGQA